MNKLQNKNRRKKQRVLLPVSTFAVDPMSLLYLDSAEEDTESSVDVGKRARCPQGSDSSSQQSRGESKSSTDSEDRQIESMVEKDSHPPCRQCYWRGRGSKDDRHFPGEASRAEVHKKSEVTRPFFWSQHHPKPSLDASVHRKGRETKTARAQHTLLHVVGNTTRPEPVASYSIDDLSDYRSCSVDSENSEVNNGRSSLGGSIRKPFWRRDPKEPTSTTQHKTQQQETETKFRIFGFNPMSLLSITSMNDDSSERSIDLDKRSRSSHVSNRDSQDSRGESPVSANIENKQKESNVETDLYPSRRQYFCRRHRATDERDPSEEGRAEILGRIELPKSASWSQQDPKPRLDGSALWKRHEKKPARARPSLLCVAGKKSTPSEPVASAHVECSCSFDSGDDEPRGAHASDSGLKRKPIWSSDSKEPTSTAEQDQQQKETEATFRTFSINPMSLFSDAWTNDDPDHSIDSDKSSRSSQGLNYDSRQSREGSITSTDDENRQGGSKIKKVSYPPRRRNFWRGRGGRNKMDLPSKENRTTIEEGGVDRSGSSRGCSINSEDNESNKARSIPSALERELFESRRDVSGRIPTTRTERHQKQQAESIFHTFATNSVSLLYGTSIDQESGTSVDPGWVSRSSQEGRLNSTGAKSRSTEIEVDKGSHKHERQYISRGSRGEKEVGSKPTFDVYRAPQQERERACIARPQSDDPYERTSGFVDSFDSKSNDGSSSKSSQIHESLSGRDAKIPSMTNEQVADEEMASSRHSLINPLSLLFGAAKDAVKSETSRSTKEADRQPRNAVASKGEALVINKFDKVLRIPTIVDNEPGEKRLESEQRKSRRNLFHHRHEKAQQAAPTENLEIGQHDWLRRSTCISETMEADSTKRGMEGRAGSLSQSGFSLPGSRSKMQHLKPRNDSLGSTNLKHKENSRDGSTKETDSCIGDERPFALATLSLLYDLNSKMRTTNNEDETSEEASARGFHIERAQKSVEESPVKPCDLAGHNALDVEKLVERKDKEGEQNSINTTLGSEAISETSTTAIGSSGRRGPANDSGTRLGREQKQKAKEFPLRSRSLFCGTSLREVETEGKMSGTGIKPSQIGGLESTKGSDRQLLRRERQPFSRRAIFKTQMTLGNTMTDQKPAREQMQGNGAEVHSLSVTNRWTTKEDDREPNWHDYHSLDSDDGSDVSEEGALSLSDCVQVSNTYGIEQKQHPNSVLRPGLFSNDTLSLIKNSSFAVEKDENGEKETESCGPFEKRLRRSESLKIKSRSSQCAEERTTRKSEDRKPSNRITSLLWGRIPQRNNGGSIEQASTKTVAHKGQQEHKQVEAASLAFEGSETDNKRPSRLWTETQPDQAALEQEEPKRKQSANAVLASGSEVFSKFLGYNNFKSRHKRHRQTHRNELRSQQQHAPGNGLNIDDALAASYEAHIKECNAMEEDYKKLSLKPKVEPSVMREGIVSSAGTRDCVGARVAREEDGFENFSEAIRKTSDDVEIMPQTLRHNDCDKLDVREPAHDYGDINSSTERSQSSVSSSEVDHSLDLTPRAFDALCLTECGASYTDQEDSERNEQLGSPSSTDCAREPSNISPKAQVGEAPDALQDDARSPKKFGKRVFSELDYPSLLLEDSEKGFLDPQLRTASAKLHDTGSASRLHSPLEGKQNSPNGPSSVETQRLRQQARLDPGTLKGLKEDQRKSLGTAGGNPYRELSQIEQASIYPKIRAVVDERAEVLGNSVSFDDSLPAHVQAQIDSERKPQALYEYEYETSHPMFVSYNSFGECPRSVLSLEAAPVPEVRGPGTRNVLVQVEVSHRQATRGTVARTPHISQSHTGINSVKNGLLDSTRLVVGRRYGASTKCTGSRCCR